MAAWGIGPVNLTPGSWLLPTRLSMEGGGLDWAEAGWGGGQRTEAVGSEQRLPVILPSCPLGEQLTVVGKISFNPKDVLGRGAGGTFVFR